MMLVLFLVIFVTFELNQITRLTRAASSIDGQIVRLAERLSNNMFSMVSFEKKYLISKDDDFYRRFLQINDHFNKDMQQLGLMMIGPKEKAIFLKTSRLCNEYFSIFTQELEFIKKNKKYPHKEYQVQKETILEKINDSFQNINQTARSNRDEKIKTSSQISYDVFIITSIAAGLSIFFGILISFFNTRSINRSILLLQEKTKDIADGKFEKITGIASPPEIEDLANDFNKMCQRLRELDALKEDFISHVSHELRTPLTAIREASGLLIEGAFTNKPKSRQELLIIVKEECERLIVSVNRILDLSRMEAKMMEYQFHRISLIHLVRKCLVKLAPIAKRKKIALKLRRQRHLPEIRMDGERISLLLDNLIGNALKFTDKGGSVTVTVYLKNHGNRVIVVSISDTGCGILKNNLDKIFNKFKRIEGGKETARGTGLGLSIAKHVINAHGGKIWVESIPGRGSTFFFTLPAA